MQVSSQGRDGSGGMTTQDDLPQNKNCTVPSEETAPHNSAQHQKHIVSTAKNAEPRNPCAALSACPAGSASASVVSASERGGRGSERMTGREEEVQKESPD